MSKYNEGKSILGDNYSKSSIWKYLHKDIDSILAVDLDAKSQKKAYISLPEIEEQLSDLLKYNPEQRYYMLSGLTGIGKTTIMRHIFFSDQSNNKPIIKKRNLIIPIDFDSFIEPHSDKTCRDIFEKMYINAFEQAILTVQSKYSLSDVSDFEFVDFFTQNYSGIINYIDQYGKRNSPSQMRAEVYKDVDNRIYAVIADLCILLNRKESKIKNVILIVDNIESLGVFNTPLEVPLLTAHKVINFMCKKSITSRGKPKWTPNILICCRHYIYRMMHSRNFEDGTLSQIFESYSKPTYLDLDNPVDFSEIIEKRFNSYLSKYIKDGKRRNSINIVHDMVFKILDKSNVDSRNILLDFNLCNIRSTLKTVKDIIYNKTWIQRDDFEKNGSFIIDNLLDFNCSRTNVLRAIGMKSGYLYNREDNLIPNLLANTSDNDINVYNLLTLCYFMQIASSWRTPLEVGTFHSYINDIFKNSNLKEKFELSIWHLLRERMLLRSADQEQKDISSITFENYKKINFVYVSDAARDYWTLLGENSTIFEMLMDDIYLNETYNFRTERQIKYRLFNKEAFLTALYYLQEIFAEEESLIKIAINNNMIDEYQICFGSEFVCEHLLKGLKRSFENYFRSQWDDEIEYIAKCNVKIRFLSNQINQLKRKLTV